MALLLRLWLPLLATSAGVAAVLEIGKTELVVAGEHENFQLNWESCQTTISEVALVSPEKHFRDVRRRCLHYANYSYPWQTA